MTQPRDAAPWLSQGKYFIHTMIKIDYFCEGTRVSTKEERPKKKESEEKEDRRGN